jgi:hypothetical protein
MRFKQLAILLSILLISPFLINCTSTAKAETTQTQQSLYVGVDVAFESIAQTEQLINNISSYTNFFVIGCAQRIGSNDGFGIYNETRLTLISQYVYNKGLNFIVYSDDPSYPSKQWLENAKANFGSKFMGIYYLDEEGGKQLDQTEYPLVTSAENFSDAANQYVTELNSGLRSGSLAITNNFGSPNEYQLFTSDYGLYWYDYEAGYSTVFAEFGYNTVYENYSRQLSIALCRGAATAFNQNWGVMITWAYKQPPYMESGPELYNDMVLAYENGAKYIVVFDSNANWTENVLQQGQLDAIKQFWQYTQDNPRTVSQVSDRSAYVLPQDFGYGFRSPNDTIFGLWNADWDGTASLNFVADISMCVVTFLQMFGPNLDILYTNGNETVKSLGYQNVIYWNDTSMIPSMPAMPPQTAATSIHTSQPTTSYIITIELYAIVASTMVALAVTGVALSLRRRQSEHASRAGGSGSCNFSFEI